jgi:effector-binding domain-containing protein
MGSAVVRKLAGALFALALFSACGTLAQTAAGDAPSQGPATPAPATPSPAPSAPAADTAPLAPNPDQPSPATAATGAIVDLTARPSAYLEGKANRDEIYAAIMGSLATIRAEIDKAGLKPAGRPLAVFLQADDEGFRYRAEIPIESAPAGKTELSPAIKLGQTPVGKAMRFEHRGAYDDIDATYEAITAYLDEKGIDAQDVFVEEYLNDVKTSDDPNLQVDIYVLMK